MTAVSRQGDLCTGHTCWPPRLPVSWSTNVRVNGRFVLHVGNKFDTHCCFMECHDGTQVQGSPNFNSNGKPVARIGDAISCGSKNGQGSPNVFANGR